jgi:hypothetical protein
MATQEGTIPGRFQAPSTLLKVLAEDTLVVSYRPQFARMTGSVMAAILLQQLLHRWMQAGRQAFYKFKEPCKHSDYRTGDSWCEELAFTRREFDSALSLIGTKVTKGCSKNDLMTYCWPGLPAEPDSENYRAVWSEIMRHVVIYWTDANRVTWYWLNETLLERVISVTYSGNVHFRRYIYKGGKRLYLGKGGKRRQRVKAKSAVTCSAESPPSVVVDSDSPSESGSQQQQRDPTPAEHEAFRDLSIGEPVWRPWMEHPPKHVLACVLHASEEPGVTNPVGLLRAMLEREQGAPGRQYIDRAERVLAGEPEPDPYQAALEAQAAVNPPPALPPPETDPDGSLNKAAGSGRLTWREVWIAVRGQLELQLSQSAFEIYIRGLRPLRYADCVLTVRAHTSSHVSWLDEHDPVSEPASRLAGLPVVVRYVAPEAEVAHA